VANLKRIGSPQTAMFQINDVTENHQRNSYFCLRSVNFRYLEVSGRVTSITFTTTWKRRDAGERAEIL
jgi:hypothetical protein